MIVYHSNLKRAIKIKSFYKITIYRKMKMKVFNKAKKILKIYKSVETWMIFWETVQAI
jgi:hypothetical protein